VGKKLIPVVILVVLIVAAFGSGRYLAAFKVEREPETLALGITPAVRDAARALSAAYTGANPGCEIALVEMGPGTGGESGEESSDPAELLASGAVDCVVAELEVLDAAGLGDGEPVFHRATIISVDFPSVHTVVSLEEAQTIVADLRAGRPGPWPEAGARLIDLAGRSPDRQLIAVETGGKTVYPTLETVLDGAYPLSMPVGFAARELEGLAAFAAGLPLVGGWLEPNRELVDDFVAWLGTDEAAATFYGTSREITVAAVGDVMMGRKTGRMIDTYGLDFLFGNVAQQLSAADITWCNLEAPLGTTGTPIPGKVIWLRGKPEYAQCLKMGGFDVVSAANNHILDFDSPCLLETLDALEGAGIKWCGAGKNATAAREPAVIEAGGLKVAFLAYTQFAADWLFWDFGYPRTFLADELTPGCNPLDLEMVAEDIARAKETADLVVVCYHWGMEDIPYPQPFPPWSEVPLETIARETIDLGACLVLGTHPHALQGYEVYSGGLIAYSLGNFANDQNKPTQKETVILELQVGDSGVLSARFTPCWIQDTCEPVYLDGAEAERILAKIEEISQVFKDRD